MKRLACIAVIGAALITAPLPVVGADTSQLSICDVVTEAGKKMGSQIEILGRLAQGLLSTIDEFRQLLDSIDAPPAEPMIDHVSAEQAARFEELRGRLLNY